MNITDGFEAVIGLEVHVELKTSTKIFCTCSTKFGLPANSNCCPVCMGFPGTLPVLNQKVVEYAIKAGLVTNCKISNHTKLDRKNYFYPDLPKAYQISQFDIPLCCGGYIDISADGSKKRIGITRIHIEEDAGKLIHDRANGTLVDYNRCGVPLIEIVSEPDISSADQAVEYVKKLRSLMMFAGVSDCRMNEGALRCDVNISVREEGKKSFGTRTEIKNINSFAFIKKAIDYEFERQVAAIKSGEEISRETRRFDEASGKTFSMRKKESLADYRFFPEPDIPPFCITEEQISAIRKTLPRLPEQRFAQYISDFGLNEYDSGLLTAEKEVSDYFERCVEKCNNPKLLANYLITELLKSFDYEKEKFPVSENNFAFIINMVSCGEINSSTAKKLIKKYSEESSPEISPDEYAKINNLLQINDKAVLAQIIAQVINEAPKAVSDYKAGRSGAVKAIMGSVMAKTAGRANPIIADEIIMNLLESK